MALLPVTGACQVLGWLGLLSSGAALLLDPYFSATKLAWLLDQVPGARPGRAPGALLRAELCFGTVDSFLLFRLTGGAVHATDRSNAARTLLFNIHTLAWDEELRDSLRSHPRCSQRCG